MLTLTITRQLLVILVTLHDHLCKQGFTNGYVVLQV